jgi:hypothetical protein
MRASCAIHELPSVRWQAGIGSSPRTSTNPSNNPARHGHPSSSAYISHNRAKKGFPMLTVLVLILVYGGVRALVKRAMRGLPRSNDDMIFF